MKTLLIAILTVLVCGIFAAGVRAADSGSEAIQRSLQARIEYMQSERRFECRGELICGIAELPPFYRRNQYKPVWLDSARAHPRVNDLLTVIQSSRQEGLVPEDYHLLTIETLLVDAIVQRMKSDSPTTAGHIETLVELELMCTDAYLLLASHLLAGRINPETLYAKWAVADLQVDLAAELQKAAEDNRIASSLQRLLPPHTGYAALKKKLAWYRFVSSAYRWAPIPAGRTIRSGDRDPRLPAIAGRLHILGDLPVGPAGGPKRFNGALAAAVMRFQKRHGLKPDGIVGDQTLAMLNVTPTERIRQIELNLERWRWIPRDLGQRHLLVNIADYSLSAVEAGRPAMRMRVVVGQNYRRTPVFSDKLETIEINPYWNVPTKLAVEDLLPKIKNDRAYLTRNDFSVFAGWGEDAPELDPADIDWSALTADNFWYRLRQNPGPTNALGRMKFIFPNRFAVYLHDTPSRELFTLDQRGFSSGCIRVERPIDLAEYLLTGQAGWNRKKVLESVADGGHTIVRLKDKMDIHITYWTAWVDWEGTLQFRDDVYDRDDPLAKALQERVPRLVAVNNGGI